MTPSLPQCQGLLSVAFLFSPSLRALLVEYVSVGVSAKQEIRSGWPTTVSVWPSHLELAQ